MAEASDGLVPIESARVKVVDRYILDTLKVHDPTTAFVVLETRRGGAVVTNTLREERRLIRMYSEANEALSRLAPGAEGVWRTVGAMLRFLSAYAAKTRLQWQLLRKAVVAAVVKAVYAHALPLYKWEIARALGYSRISDFDSDYARGLRVLRESGALSVIGVDAWEARGRRVELLARRLAQESGLGPQDVDAAGLFARALVDAAGGVGGLSDVVAATAVYFSLRMRGVQRPRMDDLLGRVAGESPSRYRRATLHRRKAAFLSKLSVVAVYPPAYGRPVGVRVVVGEPGVHVYCAACGSLVKSKSPGGNSAPYKPPARCPRCGARLGRGRGIVYIARAGVRAEFNVKPEEFTGFRVVAVKGWGGGGVRG